MRIAVKIKVIVALVCCSYQVAGQPGATEPVETTDWCQVGDKKIALKTWRYGAAQKYVIINLHHNEITAIDAAQKVLSTSGGTMVYIENEQERIISFRIGNNLFRFDPNRIFTDAGIHKTLHKLSGRVTPGAIRAVREFATFVKSKLPATVSVVIAVHNNEDGDLSVDSYGKDGDLRREASQVHATPGHDADNFFLTTDVSLFRKLKAAGYNAVLQHNKRVTNDGSLSVYYGLKKKRYVNVEAETGALDMQQEMITSVIGILKKK
ncbi:MAG: hypothetical protein ABW007_08395 [Chitinophagaceae bacterium]